MASSFLNKAMASTYTAKILSRTHHCQSHVYETTRCMTVSPAFQCATVIGKILRGKTQASSRDIHAETERNEWRDGHQVNNVV